MSTLGKSQKNELDEMDAAATPASVNGMGDISFPGNPGSQDSFDTQETGSGDIPATSSLTDKDDKKKKAKKIYDFLKYNAFVEESVVNEARDSVYIKQLTDTFKKFKLSRKYEIMMDSSYGAGGKIPVVRPKGGFGDGAMIDNGLRLDGDGKIVIKSSKSGMPIPGESEFTNIDNAMVAATEYVDTIDENVHNLGEELEDARMMRGSVNSLNKWAEQKIKESHPSYNIKSFDEFENKNSDIS